MRNSRPTSVSVVLLSALIFTAMAQAADVTVDCSAKKNNSINAALATLSKGGPNTIRVSGICNEAVLIDGFDRLTLVGNPTATINDPTPSPPETEDTNVINISDSDRVVLRNLVVNGGVTGIACGLYSVCHLLDVHVHNSVDTGVLVFRSSAVIGDSTVIEDNAGSGVLAGGGANVHVIPFNTNVAPTIQQNGVGVTVVDDAHVTIFGAVQNNAGDGINLQRGSNIRLFGTVTGNGGSGLFLRSSTARIAASTITGNSGSGVTVANLSFASFAGNDITGNGAPDVNCTSATAVTTGSAGGGGTTNCTEPAP